MKQVLFRCVASMALLFATCPYTPAQVTPNINPGPNGNALDTTGFGRVTAYLRMDDGQPLSEKATPIVRIASAAGGAPLNLEPHQAGNSAWFFDGVGINNDYDVLVTASGYFPARERVRLANTPGASVDVIVLMRPVDQELVFHQPNSDFALPPKAQKEIQRALEALQEGKIAPAQKHAENAIQLAPDNPYVQYVMGMRYLLTKQFSQAKPYLEKSVSIDSRQPAALNALGTVRYRLGDNPGAVEVLTKAVQLDGSLWKAEWMLSVSYLGEKKYAEARDHAQQAIKLGTGKAGLVQLALGQAYAGLGQREEAAKVFDEFASKYPSDPNAANASKWAKLMREPAKVNVSPSIHSSPPSDNDMAMPPEPAVEVPPRADWAPRDIDAVQPFVISDATCSLPQILDTAGKNAESLVQNLQQFSATEDFQEVEIKRSGDLEKPASRSFNYLVFIDQVSPERFDVKEVRGQDSSATQFPGLLADMGAPVLAMAFHPTIQPDLDWKCEGLGRWNDQPAWVIHLQQRLDRPNVLASFRDGPHEYAVPLKGRAWVSENGGQVLHLETDLVKEIQPVDLKRQHFSIDYRLVSFQTHKVDLWLPENVDSYIQYRGHFLHHYHHFSNFQLFWVGATDKVGAPKEAKTGNTTKPKSQDQ